MSVTSDLVDGPLKLFLDEWLPRRHRAVGPWRAALRRGRRVHPAEMPFREDVGTALELRIGLDLAQRPAGYQRELASLPPTRCGHLMRAAGFNVSLPPFEVEETVDPLLRDWHRASRPSLPVDDEQVEALLACYDMAHFTSVFGRKERGWTVEETRAWLQHPSLFAKYLGHHHEEARESLTTLWERYVSFGRTRFLAYGDRVVLKPEVATNYGVADLVVGRTLIDVKVYADPEPHLERWLDQLLAYALLDEFGNLFINRLAIYLGWEGLLVDVGLADVIADSQPSSQLSAADLRTALREALADELWLARDRRDHQLLDCWIPSTESTA